MTGAGVTLDAGERVVLTSFERAPEDCHRHCVAEALLQAYSGALGVTDL